MIIHVVFRPGSKEYGYIAPANIVVGQKVKVQVGDVIKEVLVTAVDVEPIEHIQYKEILPDECTEP